MSALHAQLRWITRVVVGSDVDPEDRYYSEVLQYRVSGKSPWTDVPRTEVVEQVSAYTGEKL